MSISKISLKQLVIFILLCASFVAGYKLGDKPPEVKTVVKTVTEVQERERVVTRKFERPDGTTETVVVENRTKDTNKSMDASRQVSPRSLGWSVSLSAGRRDVLRGKPTYTLGVDKRLLAGLSAGIYARTDKEIGLSLRYSF